MAAALLHSATMGVIGCLAVGLHLIDGMLDHVFLFRTCNHGIIQEVCIICCGKHVEDSTTPGHPVFFRKHAFTQARKMGPEFGFVCSLLSHKFGERVMALSTSWYRLLYPLGLMAFALNSRDSQTGGSWLKVPQEDHREISK